MAPVADKLSKLAKTNEALARRKYEAAKVDTTEKEKRKTKMSWRLWFLRKRRPGRGKFRLGPRRVKVLMLKAKNLKLPSTKQKD
jgi:hypothetical protein